MGKWSILEDCSMRFKITLAWILLTILIKKSSPTPKVGGREHLQDPRGFVVGGLNAPGRVSKDKQVLGDSSD